MVIEKHPALFDLSPEDKLRLSEELCQDLLLNADKDPELSRRVQARLAAFQAGQDEGISWDQLKANLLQRQSQ